MAYDGPRMTDSLSPAPAPRPPGSAEVVPEDGTTSRGGFPTRRVGVLAAVTGLVAAGGIGLSLRQDEPARGSGTSVHEAAPTPADSCLGGDPAACETLLSLLAEECFAGSLDSCDVLYEISAPESDHEDYGATCGGRFDDWTFAGVCRVV
jgi:hypothetical protein